MFRLEREFAIHIPRGELFPESVFGNDPNSVRDGCVTDEGLGLLRHACPTQISAASIATEDSAP